MLLKSNIFGGLNQEDFRKVDSGWFQEFNFRNFKCL